MQTAVKFLIKEIESLITIETFEKWKSIKEQANKMFEQQIIDAWKDGYGGDEHNEIEYYNETYKK
jgi:hypothetical protein